MSDDINGAEPVIGYVRYTVPVNMTKMVKARHAKGCMSQKDIARAIKTSPSQICSAESGSRSIDGDVFDRWCAEVGVSLRDVKTDPK